MKKYIWELVLIISITITFWALAIDFKSSLLTMALGLAFLMWNLLPAIVFYIITRKILSKWELNKAAKISAVFLFLFLIALPAGLDIMWIFDINGTATSSSTSALIFIFIPILALGSGMIALVVLSVLNGKLSKQIAGIIFLAIGQFLSIYHVVGLIVSSIGIILITWSWISNRNKSKENN